MGFLNKILSIFGGRQQKDSHEEYPYFVYAKIIEPALPEARGRMYHDPLADFLERKKLGTVTGGGTQLGEANPLGERVIEYIGLDIELADLDEGWNQAKQKLNELGVPVGSELIYRAEDGSERNEPIGEMELLSVFVEKMNDADSDLVCEKLAKAVIGTRVGELRGVGLWESGRRHLYFVGQDADKMFEQIKRTALALAPLKNARCTFQRRDKTKMPQEIQL